jgi:hypothetical protein
VSAQELFHQLHRLSAEVVDRLAAVGRAQADARPLAESLTRDLQRHAAERRELGRKRGLVSHVATAAGTIDSSLAGLRAAQEALMLAHADGLPALRAGRDVKLLAGHMADVARHLTITDLWIAGPAETDRG